MARRYANATSKLRAELDRVKEQAFQAVQGAGRAARALRVAEDKLKTQEQQLNIVATNCERWGMNQPAAAIRTILRGES